MPLALTVVDALGLAGITAACAGMGYLGYRIEPHWAAKDGRRFVTTVQELDRWATPVGRRREVHVRLDRDDGLLEVSRRGLGRPWAGLWRITGKSADPPRGRAVYLLELVRGDTITSACGTEPASTTMAMRLPTGSRVVPILDAMIEPPPAESSPS